MLSEHYGKQVFMQYDNTFAMIIIIIHTQLFKKTERTYTKMSPVVITKRKHYGGNFGHAEEEEPSKKRRHS